MTMIERVAASIVIAQQRGLDRNGVARAAIEAMREPTRAMLLAGDKAVSLSDLSGYEIDSDLEVAWPAMIDQAMKDDA